MSNFLYWWPFRLRKYAYFGPTFLQDALETKLERKRKNQFGAPVGKKMVVFVDDVRLCFVRISDLFSIFSVIKQLPDSSSSSFASLLFDQLNASLILSLCSVPPLSSISLSAQHAPT